MAGDGHELGERQKQCLELKQNLGLADPSFLCTDCRSMINNPL